MSSNNNPDNTKAQPAGGSAIDETLSAAPKKHRDEGLILGFGDESNDTAESGPAEKKNSGGLVFGSDFPPLKLTDDADEEEQPRPKKGLGRIIFSAAEQDDDSLEEADRKAREAAERKAREEAERKEREEAERKAREEAERKAREEAERKAREEAERKAREEAAAAASGGGLFFGDSFMSSKTEEVVEEKKTADPGDSADGIVLSWSDDAKPAKKIKAKEEIRDNTAKEPEQKPAEINDRKARKEAERKAREEAERKEREEAERKEREEAERKAREEAERKAREEAERKEREEAERKEREEAERKAREEAERKEREEAERKAREEAERKAKEEEKARKEAERKAREEEARAKKEAERKAKEEAKARKEAERRAKEEAERKAKEEAERAEEERRAKEEEDRKAAASRSLADVLGIAAATAAKPAEKAVTGAPAVKPEPKPAAKIEPKPAAKAEQKPVEKAVTSAPAVKPEQKPAAKIEQKPAEKAVTGAPAVKPEPKPAAKTEQKPAEKAVTGAPAKAENPGGEMDVRAVNIDLAGDESDEMRAEIAAAVRAVKADRAKHGPVGLAQQDTADKPAGSAAKKTAKPEKTAKKSKKGKDGEPAPLKPMLSIANIVYTAVLFGSLAAAFIFLPRSGISESEQRMLAEFPQFSAEMLTKGQYTNGITEFFNDNVPFREEIKKAAVQMRKLYGISYNNAEVIGPMVAVTEEPEEEPVTAETEPPAETVLPEMSAAVTEEPDAAETDAPAQTEAPVETTAPVTAAATTVSVQHPNEIAEGVITNGQVVTKLEDGHWWGISLFGGGAGTKYADALNRFKKALGDDVNIYNMVVPTSGEYYLPDIYSTYNASHRKSIDSINEKLDGVIPVPAIDALAAHASEDIYLRTDHHWQPLGAYYAAKCFAETAGVPFADISTMEKVSVDGYMGTMWSFTKSANLGGDPEVFTYYKPSNSYTTYYYDTAYKFDYSLPFFVSMPTSSMYSTFMGGDKKIVRISTDAGTGRKLVVFKDSYGNAEIPFYFGSFDEIYVCDMRYFDLNAIDFIKFTGATDVLFTMCTFSAVGTNANGLDVVLSNPSVPITETAG